MKSYYFSFEPTGIAEIDIILTAVAGAGKYSHHTEGWSDPVGGDEGSPRDWIQNAAAAAAAEVLRLRNLLPTCERGPKACDAEIDRLKAELADAQALLARGVELFGRDDEELKRLRAILKAIAEGYGGDEQAIDWPEFYASVKRQARAALEQPSPRLGDGGRDD